MKGVQVGGTADRGDFFIGLTSNVHQTHVVVFAVRPAPGGFVVILKPIRGDNKRFRSECLKCISTAAARSFCVRTTGKLELLFRFPVRFSVAHM